MFKKITAIIKVKQLSIHDLKMAWKKNDQTISTEELYIHPDFPGGSVIKNPPAMQESWVQYLGWEDPLEKKTVTHSSIFAWETPWTEKPGGLQFTVVV